MLKIHKASAGSGKTYTLTFSYIKLLLGRKLENGRYTLAGDSNRHRNILAITFTNKATDEMKRRIVHQLALLAGLGTGKSDYEARLCEELGCDVDSLQRHAFKALHELLGDFSNFNISTIDSFFQTVLRTFAREANLSGNYDVELDDNNAIAVGINEMLASINRTTETGLQRDTRMRALMHWLGQYMRFQINSGKQFNLFNRRSYVTKELGKYVAGVLSETYKLNASRIDSYLADPERIIRFTRQLSNAIAALPRRLAEFVAPRYSVLESAGIIDMMPKRPMADHLARWRNGIPGATQACLTAFENPDKRYKKNKQPGADMDALVSEIMAEAIATVRKLTLLNTVRESIYSLGLIGEIQRQATDFQAENNSILLRDTNDILRHIISEAEAPFIYERLGVRLRHFLIDEFQDTSRLQWINLSPLVRESLATGCDNLIIGDEKQAIYRFRNSDPDLLMKDVPEEFAGRTEIHGNIPSENTNWRSAPEVVRFNNTMFRYMAGQLDLTGIYSNVIQQVARKDKRGYVKASPYTTAEEALDSMTSELKRQLAAGYTLADIAILVSSHVDGETVMSHLLRVKQEDGALASLQILSEDSLIVGHAPSVSLIVSVLRYIDSRLTAFPDAAAPEKKPLAVINNRYNFYLSRGLDRIEAIRHAFGEDAGSEELAGESAEMTCINLPSMVERVINRYLLPETREKENVYISAFQDIVIDYCERPDADLHSFIRWWDDTGCTRSLAIASEVNAVRVMTIHKSKGLEFPCVHIPLISWPLDKHLSKVWFSTTNKNTGEPLPAFSHEFFDPADIPPFIPLTCSSKLLDTDFGDQYMANHIKEYADTINKTYVGFTRAVNELVIGYKVKPGKDGKISDGESGKVCDLVRDTLRGAGLSWCRDTGIDMSLLADLAAHTGDDGKFELGEPTLPGERKARTGDVRMPVYEAFDNDHIWELSRIEDLEEMALPRQRGIILHSIMSCIRTPRDIRRAVLRHVMRGYIAAEDEAGYVDMLTRAIAASEVKPWFEGFTRLLMERAFIAPGSGGVERYKPDRVVWRADGRIDVIDFKFGEEEPRRYFRQVKRYCAALRGMYPGAAVTGYLWYPVDGHVTPVE